jgi:glutamine amidotransferase
MSLAVIDYGAGNLPNVVRALTHIGAPLTVTSDPTVVANATAIVLPGVGATRDTMEQLTQRGLVPVIRDAIRRGVPFLGICVGMQVLLTDSLEFGHHECLGVISGTVRRFPAEELKVPQIGWNEVYATPTLSDHPLFDGIPDGSDFYFVHSYYCDVIDPAIVAGTTTYGASFPSILMRDTLVAAQFHPEKSGALGLRFLRNFVTHIAQIECEPTHV